MASHVALDKDNNLVLQNGTFAIVQDGAELVQRLRSRLLAYLGEWFLDRDSGVPYFQEIFKKPADIANIESLIKQRILETDDVTNITEFAITFGTTDAPRKLLIAFSFESIYGTYEGVTIDV